MGATSYCCAGVNDCEVATQDTCPDGQPGPMPYGQCVSECMKVVPPAASVEDNWCKKDADCEPKIGPSCKPTERPKCMQGECYCVKIPGSECWDGCNVVLTACNSSDPLQKWASDTFASGYSSTVTNVGSSNCLEAIQVDPIQVASCIPTPGSGSFTYSNGTLAVTGGMMHNGFCLDAHKDVGLRPCNTTNPAQHFVLHKTSGGGALSQNGQCLSVSYK